MKGQDLNPFHRLLNFFGYDHLQNIDVNTESYLVIMAYIDIRNENIHLKSVLGPEKFKRFDDIIRGNANKCIKEVLARGMRNPWLGPHRPDCIIGEDPKFIALHAAKTHGAKLLPVPWGKGFSDQDSLFSPIKNPRKGLSLTDIPIKVI